MTQVTEWVHVQNTPTKNSYKSIKKKNKEKERKKRVENKKVKEREKGREGAVGRRLNWHITKEDMKMAHKHMKKDSPLIIQKM